MCQVDGCNRKLRCKGLCQYHYHKGLYGKYKDRAGLRKISENPHPKTTQAEREFNEGLWEFVKKELGIQC